MKPKDRSELKANAVIMAQRLKVMSHAERLLMLCRMDEGEVSVNELVGLTGLSQSGVSQHLALLRAEDMVHVRIDAQTRWYSLKDPVVSGIIHAMCELCDRIDVKSADFIDRKTA
jgi:ArsR family transcriptional regulator